MTKIRILACVALLPAFGLAGCAHDTFAADFGAALKENTTAQIANPEPRYKGNPDPGSAGERVGLAQKRYATGKTLKPSATGAAVDVGGDAGAMPAPQ
jgi:type IV pilus biogenesis protein CpaD/CtpE